MPFEGSLSLGVVMAYTVTAYIVMAYTVMAYTVVAYTVMAYIAMAVAKIGSACERGVVSPQQVLP